THKAHTRTAILLLQARIMKHFCAIFQPTFCISNIITNQVLAQLELWQNSDKYEIGLYRLPKQLDEEVARLHLDHIGVKLTKLTKKQADYLGIPENGPYKPEHYRY